MHKKITFTFFIMIFATCIFAGMQKGKGMCPGPGPCPKEDMMGPHYGEHGLASWFFMGKWWKDHNIKKDLNLSDEQITKLDNLILQHKKDMIDIRANIQKKQLELEELLDKENADDNMIMKKADELITLRSNLQKTFIKMILDMRKVLTPEQNKKLKEIKEMARNKIRDRLQIHKNPDNPPSPPPPPPPEE